MKLNIDALKAKMLPNRTGSCNDVPFKDMDTLDHIEKIVEISKKYGINKCFSKGKGHIDFVAGKLSISPLQTVLFSHFMEKSNENQIQISEIAESIKCSKVRIIKYINECEALEKKKLVRCSRDNGSISFRIPKDVLDSLRQFNEFRPEKKENLTIDKFFTVLEDLFQERSNNELTFEALVVELLDLIKQNMHLEFCKKILSYNLGESSLTLLLCFCLLFEANDDDNIGMHDLEFLYEDRSHSKSVHRDLSSGECALINAKFIEAQRKEKREKRNRKMVSRSLELSYVLRAAAPMRDKKRRNPQK
jgi:hypothetical protein